jgi:predicted AlkP superfamily phosphohydrolase/phosphomutase
LEYALTHKPWEFAMHVNMGVDRIHHGFWRYHDPQHRLYTVGNPFEHAIHDYYVMVDRWLGRLLEKVGDDTTVLVVSDHGVKRMDGGVCLNEWLWRNGWLHFKTLPKEGQSMPGESTPFDENHVDWSRTRAWGSGGYYGRVSLNVLGREPQGTVTPEAYDSTRDELSAALCAIPDHEGKPLNTRVYKPQEIYRQVNGIAPDLLVYFGDLHWRSVGSVGHGAYTTFDNDTGPDDANHAVEGMFIWHDPKARGRGQIQPHQLMDIAPTILNYLGAAIPPTMQGKIIG